MTGKIDDATIASFAPMRARWMRALLDGWDYGPMILDWMDVWERHPIGCDCPTYCGTASATCLWPGCERTRYARQRCYRHYRQWRRRKYRIERNAPRVA